MRRVAYEVEVVALLLAVFTTWMFCYPTFSGRSGDYILAAVRLFWVFPWTLARVVALFIEDGRHRRSISLVSAGALIGFSLLSLAFETLPGKILFVVVPPFPGVGGALAVLVIVAVATYVSFQIVFWDNPSKAVCSVCGYNLAGLASGSPCPECGKASAESAVSPPSSGS